jgi:Tfp pilus assembly protein FimT
MSVKRSGFTLVEFLVIAAILGILSMSIMPGILNSLETRALENAAHDVIASLEKAKFEAVKTKFNHRIRFLNQDGIWRLAVERESPPGTWTQINSFLPKSIDARFNVTVNLPPADQAVEFSQLGFVDNHDKDYNSILFQSEKLKSKGQEDQRQIIVMASGSFRYIKSSSES